MNDSRYATKVGLFVAAGFVLIALLVLNFSKGVTLFNPVYKVRVIMPTIAGLKPSADVMMAGVPIGKVTETALAEGGRSVNITVSLLSRFKVRKDAIFHIDSLGFLGDQYIEVSPAPVSETATNNADLLKDGDTVQGQAPFNLLAAVQSTADLLDQAHKAMKDLDQAITNVNRTVLSDETLKNFGRAVTNLTDVTEIGIKTVQDADNLIHSNQPIVTTIVTNLEAVSQKINLMADQLDLIITTNSDDINQAVKNLRDTTVSFKQLAADLEAGKGLAGSLLKDETTKASFVELMSNANVAIAQFAAFGSNLNQRGVWSMLWKPKHDERSTRQSR